MRSSFFFQVSVILPQKRQNFTAKAAANHSKKQQNFTAKAADFYLNKNTKLLNYKHDRHTIDTTLQAE